MDDDPPPTNHVLKPHHVAILVSFMLAFKEFEGRLPQPFTLHVYRVLLNEVAEVAQPKICKDFLAEFSAGPRSDAPAPRSFISSVQGAYLDLQTPDQMTSFFHSIPSLFVEKSDEEEPPLFMRRSIFGYFCRRCFVSFLKLSFSGVAKLQQDYQAWSRGTFVEGKSPAERDQIDTASLADLLIYRTQADSKTWAQPGPYEKWERSVATGDENIATENLRRFFEQHFHESNDSGVRQHALLNLVRMHYMRGEFTAAQTLLREAITVARTSGDKITLQHCISMLHRLPQMDPNSKPILNEIQPDLSPLEILYDVKKLMQVENDQPLSASFERIVQAVSLYDQWLDNHAARPAEAEQWGQHAVQSLVWAEAGCLQLATIEENIVTAFTEVGSDDNNRIVVTLNRAYKLARQGKYDEGTKMLLEPDVWRGITLNDYVAWASQIWQILVLRASRRGQNRLYREFLRPRRPPGDFDHRVYYFDENSTTQSKIRDSFYTVMQLRKCDQAATAIEQLLTGLWHSEFQGRFGLYRTGIILLADVGLEFGLTKRCRRILEEIMPQIINGDDLEQRATACFTLARCIIASDGPNADTLRESLRYLLISEADFATLQIFGALIDVQYLISVVYHNLGLEEERDEAALRHLATKENKDKIEGIAADSELIDIWELVKEVGGALAGR